MRIMSMVAAVFVALMGPALAFQQTGAVVICGGNKTIYNDEGSPPTTNQFDVTVAGVPSNSSVLAAIETELASGWKCKGCPPGQHGCVKSISSSNSGLSWTDDGLGNITAHVTGLKVVLHCSDCN